MRCPTPLAPIDVVVRGERRRLLLKLEGAGNRGSIKDRTARGLLADLNARSLLRPGSVVVESTSGNLGVALARLARAHGYRFLAVVDPKTTAENLDLLHRLGVEVEVVDRPDETGGYLLSRLERVRELCASSDRYAWPDQYTNAANPRIHERETGPEIHRQLGGGVDAVVAAVSTGGTLAGVGSFFRSASPGTRIVAVDAVGSVALGGRPAPRLLTGIGASRRSTFLTPDLYDDVFHVSDADAVTACHRVWTATGLKLGGSSGAVIAAAARFVAASDAQRVVCVCADSGDRYARSIYDASWLRRHGIDPAAPDAPELRAAA